MLPQTTKPDPEFDFAWLSEAIYLELKHLCAWHLRCTHNDVTLSPTDLTHEAIGRLLAQRRSHLNERSHALAIASMMVRRVLSNHVRDRSASKRGGRSRPVQLILEPETGEKTRGFDLLEINEAISRLEEVDARQAMIVQMKCFGGMTIEEIGRHLSLSKRTVQLEWKHAKLWLARELAH